MSGIGKNFTMLNHMASQLNKGGTMKFFINEVEVKEEEFIDRFLNMRILEEEGTRFKFIVYPCVFGKLLY